MLYIGLDVHAQNFTVCVLNGEGQVLFEQLCQTSAEKLRAAVGAFASPAQVVLEETTVAAWVYRVLDGYAHKIIVADPRANKWIAKDENIDDTRAAYKLALLLRGGYIKAVHHPDPKGQSIRELVCGYHDTSRELARAKNKLKHKFHQHGIPCAGAAVFNPDKRAQWLAKFEDPNAAFLGARPGNAHRLC